ncbi:MAG: 50S ribosomal protein L6 [Actinomycetota bacterium]|nr:50S ribosomal protein L6 [Actinomycetota bacterium]MDK1016280.1 50S ribosomal protein L6 [Actinomycetota bacterium]MDK1026036.1 50S ribosomal protein L6 [Actinomycetota bacterium]MDK1037852.1 50S ribosomal protein L6 [Actinomycetota bacterium]MDK1096869.1 50S ribosomal protein L6 [Actinomycetota bacterium]
MSRIGNSPISLPSGVDVKMTGDTVEVKGQKGTLTQVVDGRITVSVEDGVVTVARESDERSVRALHGLTRALINNMVVGVVDGYSKELTAVGVGYRAVLKGSQLELQVGFSHPVTIDAPDGVTIEVPEPTKIIVSGIDKQKVGQVAADIRAVRPPEPYKGKGIRYVDEQVRRKAGKAGVSA